MFINCLFLSHKAKIINFYFCIISTLCAQYIFKLCTLFFIRFSIMWKLVFGNGTKE